MAVTAKKELRLPSNYLAINLPNVSFRLSYLSTFKKKKKKTPPTDLILRARVMGNYTFHGDRRKVKPLLRAFVENPACAVVGL